MTDHITPATDEQTTDHEPRTLSRRSVLRTAAVTGVGLTGLTSTMGTATAAHAPRTRSGPSTSVGDGSAVAYTTRAHGRLSEVGIRFDAAVLDGLPCEPTVYDLDLPRGDTGRFQFVGLDWNPQGHEPEGLYTYPHFDVHFNLLSEATVDAIEGGPATYDIPDALLPANTVPTDRLPSPMTAPRMVVPAMGEHLVSVPASLPGTPDTWAVFIWGAYDPDGDGHGQLTFMEPMITVTFFESLLGDGDQEHVVDVPMPDRFLQGGWYPTEYAVRYDCSADAFTVSLESFASFPGYGRR